MKTNMKRLTYFLVALVAACSFTQALADAVVNPLTQPEWTIGAFTLKEPNLQLGATKAYRPWFENGSWQGDVVEYSVATDGALSTSVVLTGTSPTNPGDRRHRRRRRGRSGKPA